jgi:tetratricopeptide (TPR) repeat protein
VHCQEAVIRYKQALDGDDLDPALAFYGLTNLGICYQKLGQAEMALEEFKEALGVARQCNMDTRDQVCITSRSHRRCPRLYCRCFTAV